MAYSYMEWFKKIIADDQNLSPIERGLGADIEVQPVPAPVRRPSKKRRTRNVSRVPMKQDRSVPGFAQQER